MVTKASLATKKKILQVCVKLFLEKGYKKTTMAEIVKRADVSNSSFQNIFRAKDGVLVELVKFMFSNQFGIATEQIGENLPPIYVYAVETAIQLTLTEENEQLREIYIEAYSHNEARSYILKETAKILYRTFGKYQPKLSEEDFYIQEIGSAGIMHSYMMQHCDENFSLEKKLNWFLTQTLRAFKVPEDEIEKVLGLVMGLNIHEISNGVLKTLFKSLAMCYEFSLDGIVYE